MKNPIIRIRYSKLLHEKVSPLFWEKFRKPENKEMPDQSTFIKKAELYRSAWQEKEKEILGKMQESFSLSFHKETIDVYLAPLLPSMSTPLIINFHYTTDEFVDILTHELFHILISDNNENFNYDSWKKDNFPEKEPLVAAHVLVHAGLEDIYSNILKSPNRLERDIENCSKWPAYKEAWDIVRKIGYKNIITKSKKYRKSN